MTDFERFQEKASLYITGELNEGERREFEAQLAQSPDLQQLVRDLEAGVVAVGLSCPPRRPPPFLWRGIEQQLSEERRKIIPLFAANFWRNAGWAAAAASLAAWFFFSIWKNDSHSVAQTSRDSNRSETTDHPALAIVRSAENQDSAPANILIPKHEIEARERESAQLRTDLSNVQRQLGQISQTLAQQQAMLSEPGRLKFVALTPTANPNAVMALSPQLQRALFLAMARELGWLNASNQIINPGITQPNDSAARNALTNSMNVDFIDLRTPTNTAPKTFQFDKQPIDLPKSDAPKTTDLAETKPAETKPAEIPAEDKPTEEKPTYTAAALPAFIANDHAVVAIDATVAPAGTPLQFFYSNAQGTIFAGAAEMGFNPLVLTFDLSSSTSPIWNFQIITLEPGKSNVIDFTPHTLETIKP